MSRPTRFAVQPNSGVPIYRQLVEQVTAHVAGKRLEPGEFLPSTRELAAALEVNVMTVSKAYSALEADGVIERVRGRGMRVLDLERPDDLAGRLDVLKPLLAQAVERGRALGLTDRQIAAQLDALLAHLPAPTEAPER